MDSTTISLLDLPDELMLAIFGKMTTVDALTALTTVHHRFDSLLHDRLFVRELDFTTRTWTDDRCSIDERSLSAMRHSILPSIHHHVTSLTLDADSVACVLGVADFPQVSSLTLHDVPRQTLCQQLTGTAVLITFIQSSPSLFRERRSHPSRHPPDHSSQDQHHRAMDEHRRAERCIRANTVLEQECDHLILFRTERGDPDWPAAVDPSAIQQHHVLVADQTQR